MSGDATTGGERRGARDHTLPVVVLEVAFDLWHQENTRGQPLFTIREIAEVLGIPNGTVSAMSSRGKWRPRQHDGWAP